MKEYHKINGIYKRHREGPNKGRFIIGEFSRPEYDFLMNVDWMWTEKIDGTNIRVHWDHEAKTVTFGGRTERASIPAHLMNELNTMFPVSLFESTYPDTTMTIYGEGYGAKIQKGGGRYISDGCSFIVFDIKIDKWWMERDALVDISENLNLQYVPVRYMTVSEAIEVVKKGFVSSISEDETYIAEGLVGTPKVALFDRNGRRIVMKLKYKDFNHA